MKFNHYYILTFSDVTHPWILAERFMTLHNEYRLRFEFGDKRYYMPEKAFKTHCREYNP